MNPGKPPSPGACCLLILMAVLIPGKTAAAEEPSPPLSSAEVSDLFSQAKRHFEEGDRLQPDDPRRAAAAYRNSLLYFERVVSDGEIRNGKLYYNIGNAYFRLGDLGNAILNYLRAAQYTPSDPNLQRNLEYARSRRSDDIEIAEQTAALRILLFWHFDLNSNAKYFAVAAAFLAAFICAGIRLYLRRNGLIAASISLALLAAVFAGSLLWETVAADRNRPGVILADEVVGRKGNSETYQPSFQVPLHEGTEFTLREIRSGWYRVTLADGRETWIPVGSAGLVRED